MKKTREGALMAIVLASGLAAQLWPATSAASSLPRRQAKEEAVEGQPVPRKSTVLLDVQPQVEMVSLPPRGTPAPSAS